VLIKGGIAGTAIRAGLGSVAVTVVATLVASLVATLAATTATPARNIINLWTNMEFLQNSGQAGLIHETP
jgi:hypothetical protein